MNHVKIVATGSYVPNNCITNEQLSKWVDTSDDWIRSRTGIKTRCLSDGITSVGMGVKASIKALEQSNLKAEDIDLIIVATMTPDHYLPSTACEIQREIGAINAVCFDINAACTGFIYALHTATQFIKTNAYQTALIIGTEVISKLIDWEDRSTCVLFGDGAGAAILQKSDTPGIVNMLMGSDGRHSDALTCQSRSIRNPVSETKNGSLDYIAMSGQEIFKFVCSTIPKNILDVIHNTEYAIEAVDQFILHQANKRIIEAVAKRLKIDITKFYMNLDRYGNTSAASIPIALDEAIRTHIVKKDQLILLSGFGGGLTWGSTLVKL